MQQRFDVDGNETELVFNVTELKHFVSICPVRKHDVRTQTSAVGYAFWLKKDFTRTWGSLCRSHSQKGVDQDNLTLIFSLVRTHKVASTIFGLGLDNNAPGFVVQP